MKSEKHSMMEVYWQGLQPSAGSADDCNHSTQNGFLQEMAVTIRGSLSCRCQSFTKGVCFCLFCYKVKKDVWYYSLYRCCSPCKAAWRAKHSRRGMMTSWKHRPVSSVSWACSAIFWRQWQARTTSSTENLLLPGEKNKSRLNKHHSPSETGLMDTQA